MVKGTTCILPFILRLASLQVISLLRLLSLPLCAGFVRIAHGGGRDWCNNPHEIITMSSCESQHKDSTSEPAAVAVRVISDFACPWCYVGKARLNAAIEAFERSHPDTPPVSVSFGPYMIDTATQPGGEDYMSYNRRRWGGDGWTASLKRSSRKDGCEFAKWATWPNSMLAHCLQNFAEQTGKGDEVNNIIFQAIYERGQNASDLETLVAVASEAGLSPTEARQYLSSRQGETAVFSHDRHARSDIGVRGVPYFVVSRGGRGGGHGKGDGGGGTVLKGAVEPDAILRALESARSVAG